MSYYLAGPMRGYDRWNFPAFREACNYLRDFAGLSIISPHELDEALGFTEDTAELPAGFMPKAMRRDVEALLDVSGMMLLPGWEHSSGARFELSVAEMLWLKVCTYDPDAPYGASRITPITWPEVHSRIAEADAPLDAAASSAAWGVDLPRPFLIEREYFEQPLAERLETERYAVVADRVTAAYADEENPKDRIGQTKPRLSLVPKSAIIRIAQAFADGARKYGPFNWRTKRVKATVYVDAAERHLGRYFDGEDIDPDSGIPHLGHAGACIAILIDATETGNLVDDRPTPGAASRLIAELTEVPA